MERFPGIFTFHRMATHQPPRQPIALRGIYELTLLFHIDFASPNIR